MEKIKSLIVDNEITDALNTLESFSDFNEDIIKEIIPKDIVVIDSKDESLLGKNLFYDIEFFKDYLGSTENSISSQLSSNLNLKGSSHYFEKILSKPTNSTKILLNRQRILKSIKEKIENNEELKRSFEILKNNESSILWLFEIKNSDKGFDLLYDLVYFNNIFTKTLNTSEHFLTGYNIYRIIISPLIGVLSPISYFIIPYLIMVYKYKITIKFSDYIKTLFNSFFLLIKSSGGGGIFGNIKYISIVFSMLFYFQGLFNSFEISKATYKISQTITNKINCVIEYIKHSKRINDILWNEDIKYFIKGDCDIDTKITYFEEFKTNEFNIFSTFGSQLKIYKYILTEKYIPLFRRMYILDTLVCFSKMNEEFDFSYSNFLSNKSVPSLSTRDMWHPSIDKNKIIKNDFNIKSNIIITGPNAGGKSTIIKSLLLCIVLSQTLGISPSKNTTITPFYYISSQINIPDCKGKESLFEAEMYRSKDNIDIISKLKEKQLSFLAMDEIFNSTNPIEGISGSYAICKKLASFKNNMCIVSTHYLYITKLAKEFPNKFETYKMNAIIDGNNPIKYPYKIKKGISRQYIAIEILQENGFDKEIINDALIIKRKFISKVIEK